MIVTLRNLGIALGASMAALFLGAATQEMFVRLAPTSRTVSVADIDVGSWVGFLTMFISFCLAGVLQARWLRSTVILPWTLLGPALFVFAAYFQGLDVSGCLRRWTVVAHIYKLSCGMVTATLALPLLGVLAGFLALRLWQRLAARGGVTKVRGPSSI